MDRMVFIDEHELPDGNGRKPRIKKKGSGEVRSCEAIRRPFDGSAVPPQALQLTAIRRLSAGYPTAHFVTRLF